MFPTPKTIRMINTDCDAAATVLRGYFISSFFHCLLKIFFCTGHSVRCQGMQRLLRTGSYPLEESIQWEHRARETVHEGPLQREYISSVGHKNG